MTRECSTCRFWSSPREEGDEVYDRASEDGDYVPDMHGRCGRILHGNGCDAPFNASAAAYNAEPAVVTDGSGYAASFRTLATFSCSLYEVKR